MPAVIVLLLLLCLAMFINMRDMQRQLDTMESLLSYALQSDKSSEAPERAEPPREPQQYQESVINSDLPAEFSSLEEVKAYFEDTFTGFLLQAQKTSTTVWVLLVPIFVLLAVFIFMVSRQMLEMEQNEISIYKSRSTSTISNNTLKRISNLFTCLITNNFTNKFLIIFLNYRICLWLI